MKTFLKVMCLVFAATMLLSLCACNNPSGNTDPGTKPSVPDSKPTTPTTEPSAPAASGYKVTVQDEAGNPIVGALVQLCQDTNCFPSPTGADGVAVFNLEEAEYKVSFLKLPDGYDYTTEETNFYFADGSKELTIVLKTAG